MNSRQLQYAVTLSQTRNFSTAAEKLNISQPAFSKQIIALENELGIKLFDRGTSPLSLTSAGEFFIEKAKELIFREDVLLKTMEKYKTGERGKLVIGAVPFRSLYIMPSLIRKIKKEFPYLQIELREHGLSVLKEGLLEGEYDFAIVNLPVNEPQFDTIPLEKDILVLAVPKEYENLVKTSKKGFVKDLCATKDIPFVTVGKEQEMRKLFDALCVQSGIVPDIYATVTGVATAWEMVKNGAGATIIPRQFAQATGDSSQVVLFKIENTPYVRQSAVITRKGQFVSKYAEFAINELKNKNE